VPGRYRLLADITPLRESAAFRRLWAGTTLSSVGSALTMFAVMLQVYDLTRSPLAVGAIGVAQMVPTLIVGLLGGPVTDAMDRRKLALITSCGLAAVSAALTVQAFAGQGVLWLLYALVAAQASLNAVDRPARSTFIPGLLPAGQLAAGLALDRLSFQLTLTAGPALAGLIAAAPHLGLPACYLTDTVSFAAALYGIARLPPMRPSGGTTRPGPRAAAEGVGFIRRSQVIAGAFLADSTPRSSPCPWPCSRRSTPNGSAAIHARSGCSSPRSASAGWPVRRSPGRSGVLRARAGRCCARSRSGAGPSPGSRSLPACGWRSACWLWPAPRTRSPWCSEGPSSPRSPPISFAAGSWRPTMSSVRAARSSATWRPVPWDR
jgi:hypothetical protein